MLKFCLLFIISLNLYAKGFGNELPPFQVVEKTKTEWQKILDKDVYYIMWQNGTERPYSGKYNTFYESGIYNCASCDHPLFSSETKYDSKTGWPSFFAPYSAQSLILEEDNSWFMTRTKLRCKRCGGHLGHVFKDGPPPTGLRYCINSLALKFIVK